MGKTNGANLGLNYIYNNKLSINLGYSATNKTDSHLPDEYLKSAENYQLVNSTEPFENFESLHLMFGRIFTLTKSNSIRFLLQGGPGISTIREPEYNFSGNQYSYDTKASKKISLVLNPKIEVPVCCSIGVSVGPMIVLNDSQKYIGAGIGIMYGIVGRDR